MADGDDTASIAAGAGTGVLGGAATGAYIGSLGGPAAVITVPVGMIIGAILGGASGTAGALANAEADDIPRGEGGGKCPEGYVYNPATKSCQPTGSTAKAVSTARGIKDKEGKSIFDEAAKKLVTKKPKAGDAAATAATANQRGQKTGGTVFDAGLAASHQIGRKQKTGGTVDPKLAASLLDVSKSVAPSKKKDKRPEEEEEEEHPYYSQAVGQKIN